MGIGKIGNDYADLIPFYDDIPKPFVQAALTRAMYLAHPGAPSDSGASRKGRAAHVPPAA